MNKKASGPKLDKNSVIPALKDALEIIKLNEKAMDKVSKQKDSTNYALGIIAVGVVLSMLGGGAYLWAGYQLHFILTHLILSVGGIFLMSFVAMNLFHGKGSHEAFFRVLGYGMLLSWLGLFSVLGAIAMIWWIAVAFVALRHVHRLSTSSIVATLFITFLALMILSAMLSPEPFMEPGQFYNRSW